MDFPWSEIIADRILSAFNRCNQRVPAMSLTFSPDPIEFFEQAAIGEVEQTITWHQRGRVKCLATTWFAQFYQPNASEEALPGSAVRVIGRKGLTLLVANIND